jgi:hypothetical protein
MAAQWSPLIVYPRLCSTYRRRHWPGKGQSSQVRITFCTLQVVLIFKSKMLPIVWSIQL